MLSNPCLLFADDTKIYSNFRNEYDIYMYQLQQDIDKLLRWSKKWQMPFNISKFKSLYIGRTNPNHVYSMAGCSIEQTVVERDLGILIDNQLKFLDHMSNSYWQSKKAPRAN